MLRRLKQLISQKLNPLFIVGAVIVASVVATFIFPNTVKAGYGPNRPTYDWNKYNPSLSCTNPVNDYGRCGSMNGPVFDSFINTPSYGDEEHFNTIAPVVTGQSPTDASYSGTATAIPGKEYWIRTLVHNDANQNTNCLPIHDNPVINNCTQVDPGSIGIATNTNVRLSIASGTANGVDVMTYISASNSNPSVIWDSSSLQNNNQAFNVSYVSGSAVLYNGFHPSGLSLPDSIDSSSGTLIGYQQMNGVIPGCFNFSAYVYVKVLVTAPALKVNKLVRPISPANAAWSKSMSAKAGQEVQWKITYQDVGSTVDKNITIRDPLPKDLSLVPNSIKWYDANNTGTVQPNNALSAGGVNLGNYAPSPNDINGEIVFDTIISNSPSSCSIVNTGYGRATNIPELSSSATVAISNCNVPNISYACDALGIIQNGQTVTINKFNITASGGANFIDAVISWGDNSQNFTTNEVVGSSHTYSGNGPYTITAVAYFNVNGQQVIPTVNNCVAEANFITPSTPPTSPTPPTTLVNTGPSTSSIVAVFTTASLLGIGLYRLILRRKLFTK